MSKQPPQNPEIVKKAKGILTRMQTQPLWTMKNLLKCSLWSKQESIVNSVWNNPRTTVRGCHSFGKSYIAGNLIPTFLYAYPNSIVLSTAPTWRQVEKLIWKEVRSAFNRAEISLGGNLLPASPELQIVRDQWYAAGLSTNDPNKFQGFHAKDILIIIDEAAGVSDDIFEAIEGALASENAHLLLLGNPTAVTGTFFKSFKEPGWEKVAISAFDTPNFIFYGITEEDIASGKWERKMEGKPLPYPTMITPAWVADKYRRWGPNSIAYIARVKGDFPEGGSDNIIPLAWIEAAMERWDGDDDKGTSPDCAIGIDVAEYGDDETVIAPKRGRKIGTLYGHRGLGVMETTGVAVNIIKEERPLVTKVDVIGIGTGVEGRLRELGYNTIRVHVSESPGGSEKEKERFVNKRAQIWWQMRESLDPDPRTNPCPLSLPPDDELMHELSSVKYFITSKGQIQVEPKDALKKRIGRSPDRAEAVVIANASDEIFKEYNKTGGTWGR